MYREVTMIEVREVLRLRGEGLPKNGRRRSAGCRRRGGALLAASFEASAALRARQEITD